MIITCPSCQTRYRVQPESLGRTGRTVRCSGCSEVWFAEAPHPAEEPPPLPPPVPPTVPAAEPAVPSQRLWLAAACLLLPLAALLLARHEIVALFPDAAGIYRRLGLPVEMTLGIEFRRLSSRQRRTGDAQALVVAGEIANVSGQERAVPPIRIGLIDGEGREIDFALFDPPRATLEDDAVESFEVELGTPPAEARDFSVSFADVR